jgi:hypothetical protein
MSYLQKQKKSALGGILDDLKDIIKGSVDLYGQSKANEGAAQALQQQQAAAQMPVQMSSGIDTTQLLMYGAIGVGIIYLIKRKK